MGYNLQMARRYSRRRKHDYTSEELFSLIAALVVLGLGYSFYTHRELIVPLLVAALVIIAVSAVLVLLILKTINSRKKQRFEALVAQVQAKGKEVEIKSFINRFGSEGSKDDWTYMSYRFSWNRLKDLSKILQDSSIQLKKNDELKGVSALLKHYIEEKEEKLTRQSISHATQRFANLSGTEFEKLLVRLYEAKGYAVQHLGMPGDQGGDLVANKNGERILIQAKCYQNGPTGNAAVQEALAAMRFYDCNKGMVVSTSEKFTASAKELAHTTGIRLVAKAEVSEMLFESLKESWS